jgi:putative glycosyltransferase (TIGR04372 family)
VVITDLYSIVTSSNNASDLCIYQFAWSRSEKNLKPFKWLINQGEGWGHKRSLIEGDIEIVKNTADEITEVVLEMNQRLNGTWIETDEDKELQARFSALRTAIPKWQVQPGVRIGANFLRRYQHLL